MARLRSAGLFAGIGGIELGLERAGGTTELVCELDPAASRVLAARFPGAALVHDVRELRCLPAVDIVCAGFPCQDLSQAGGTAGIGGARSGLVDEVFRLLERKRGAPTWLLLENVPFMLHLDKGRAMAHLTERLGDLGFAWAYRVVDARAFGLPQRRRRVLVLASRSEDPRPVLLGGHASSNEQAGPGAGLANGFYWTEGLRGLGWAVDAVPTLKGGSTLGIPSPPAVWAPDGGIGTPDIRDAERLQGFDEDWTSPAAEIPGRPKGARWRLVGNAVSVPVAQWAGRRLGGPLEAYTGEDELLQPGDSWPESAWGLDRKAHVAPVGAWPEQHRYQHLDGFLRCPLRPLSTRALSGFLGRAERSSLRFPDGLLDAVRVQSKRAAGAD